MIISCVLGGLGNRSTNKRYGLWIARSIACQYCFIQSTTTYSHCSCGKRAFKISVFDGFTIATAKYLRGRVIATYAIRIVSQSKSPVHSNSLVIVPFPFAWRASINTASYVSPFTPWIEERTTDAVSFCWKKRFNGFDWKSGWHCKSTENFYGSPLSRRYSNLHLSSFVQSILG